MFSAGTNDEEHRCVRIADVSSGGAKTGRLATVRHPVWPAPLLFPLLACRSRRSCSLPSPPPPPFPVQLHCAARATCLWEPRPEQRSALLTHRARPNALALGNRVSNESSSTGTGFWRANSNAPRPRLIYRHDRTPRASASRFFRERFSALANALACGPRSRRLDRGVVVGGC